MVQHKPTPEEQLLKLIEDPGGTSGKSAESGKSGSKGPARPSFNFSGIFGKFSGMMEFWKRSTQKKGEGSSGGTALQLEAMLDIKWLNRALIVSVLIAMGYLMIDLALFKPGRRGFLNEVGITEPIFTTPNPEVSSHDAAFYLQGLKRRNPFLEAGAVSQVNTGTAPESSPLAKVNEVMQSIKLVGISWGEEPLAMVEDAASGRTYFLKKGQEFRGVKVQNITKETVTITYEGQEAELI